MSDIVVHLADALINVIRGLIRSRFDVRSSAMNVVAALTGAFLRLREHERPTRVGAEHLSAS